MIAGLQKRSLAISRQWLINLGARNATERCGHLLCELFTRLTTVGLARDTSCSLHLTQADMADALALTPVHLNRTLKKLRETGWVTWRAGVLYIHDFAALSEYCEFDAHYLAQPPEYQQWVVAMITPTAVGGTTDRVDGPPAFLNEPDGPISKSGRSRIIGLG